MTKRTATRTRRARGSLSQDEILEAAAQLIDRGGLVQLSMGALARHMDSGVTSIYWYFRSKDELLQARKDLMRAIVARLADPTAVIAAQPETGS